VLATTATLAALKTRAAILARAREFFAQHAVMEVETPILSGAAVSDPQLHSLHTQVAGMRGPRYLHTSPEYAMKRLLAAGSGDIYQVCKAFRDEEQGRWHNPEFTMIEWYRLGFDDAALMSEVEALLAHMLLGLRNLMTAERLSYSAALQRHAGVDAFASSDHDLALAALRHGIHCDSALPRDAKLDLLMAWSWDRFRFPAALFRLRLSCLAGRARAPETGKRRGGALRAVLGRRRTRKWFSRIGAGDRTTRALHGGLGLTARARTGSTAVDENLLQRWRMDCRIVPASR